MARSTTKSMFTEHQPDVRVRVSVVCDDYNVQFCAQPDARKRQASGPRCSSSTLARLLLADKPVSLSHA